MYGYLILLVSKLLWCFMFTWYHIVIEKWLRWELISRNFVKTKSRVWSNLLIYFLDSTYGRMVEGTCLYTQNLYSRISFSIFWWLLGIVDQWPVIWNIKYTQLWFMYNHVWGKMSIIPLRSTLVEVKWSFKMFKFGNKHILIPRETYAHVYVERNSWYFMVNKSCAWHKKKGTRVRN